MVSESRPASCRAGHVFLSRIPAADGRQLTNVPDYYRDYQRLRADGPEAPGEPLDDEHQLCLQRDQGELRRLHGAAAEHRPARPFRSPRTRPNRAVPRGPPVRLPHGRQRHRQRLRQREVAVQDERSVPGAVRRSTSPRSTTPARATRGSVRPACSASVRTAAAARVVIDVLPIRSARPACRTSRISISTSSGAVRIRTLRFVPSTGCVQRRNGDTMQAIRSRQNAANANQIQAIVAPRVLRFGIRVNW